MDEYGLDNIENEAGETVEDISDEVFGAAEDQDDSNDDFGAGQQEEPFDDGQQASGGEGSNNKRSLYGSIADALREDGVLDFGDDVRIDSADDFRALIDAAVNSRFDNKSRMLARALEAGVDRNDAMYYKNCMDKLEKYTDDMIRDESDAGVNLRKHLIYNNAIRMGMSEAQANREVEKSMKSGVDIDDALDARESLKNRFADILEQMTKSKEDERKAASEYYEKQTQAGIDSIMKGDVPYTSGLSNRMKQIVATNTYRKSEVLKNGEQVTPLEKYIAENPVASKVIFGTLFTITKGFKDFSSLGKSEANKAIKKGVERLESVLSGSYRNGGMRYANNIGESGSDDDGGGWTFE